MNIIEANIVGVVDPVLNYSLENFPEINSEEWSISSVVSNCNNVTVNVLDGSHFKLTPKEIANFTDVITINLVYTNDGTPDFFTYRTVEFGLNVIAYDFPTWNVTNNNNFDVSVGFQKHESYTGDPISIYTAVGNRKPKQENFTERTAAFMVNLHPGETLYMYSDTMTKYNGSSSIYGLRFKCTADVSFGGDIMAMLKDQTLTNYSFSYFFNNCTQITTAPVLPATTLTNYCYYSMFRDCTSLATPPVLPATTLALSCYQSMFENCTSLTTAPALPAMTAPQTCYAGMFAGCTGLTTPPALPATTLALGCYSDLFSGCTSLTTAPALPAMTATQYCYQRMFQGCTSLTTAPDLPITTSLMTYSYANMFNGCTSLNYIKAMFMYYNVSGLSNWVKNVASTGTFVMNVAATWNPEDYRGASGVPNNWTVLTAVS